MPARLPWLQAGIRTWLPLFASRHLPPAFVQQSSVQRQLNTMLRNVISACNVQPACSTARQRQLNTMLRNVISACNVQPACSTARQRQLRAARGAPLLWGCPSACAERERGREGTMPPGLRGKRRP